MALHDVLLRLPPRGGRRGRAYVSHRFSAWARGDYAQLIRWWETDRAAAHHQSYSGSTPQQERQLQRALQLIGEGHISRACRLIVSSGLADLGDARVLEQLASKHPSRKEPMPSSLEGRGPFSPVVVDLAPAIRELDSYAGSGGSGFRNGYLKALLEDFSDS